MPDPVKAPPLELINEMKTAILKEVWDKFGNDPSFGLKELNKRNDKMIGYLIHNLATLKAYLIANEIDFESK